MPHIPEATLLTLTGLERAALEGLARSTKTEHRLRQRARIILLAADDMATRAIARTVGWYNRHGLEACPRADGDGGFDTPSCGSRGLTKPAIAAAPPNIRPRRRGAFCVFSICVRLTVTGD
jgi:hypothetical protein